MSCNQVSAGESVESDLADGAVVRAARDFRFTRRVWWGRGVRSELSRRVHGSLFKYITVGLYSRTRTQWGTRMQNGTLGSGCLIQSKIRVMSRRKRSL
jgi:hypothetical protein